MINAPSGENRSLFLKYLLVTETMFFVFLATWMAIGFSPHHEVMRRLLLAENRLIETLSVLFLGGAFLVSAYTLVRFRKNLQERLLYWSLFPIGIFLLLCDETSFGKVYDNWFTYPKLCGNKIDAIHDLILKLPGCVYAQGLSGQILFFAFLTFLGVLIALAIRLMVKNRALFIPSLKEYQAPLYLILAFVLFWVGGGIDILGELKIIHAKSNNFLVFLEEMIEMFAASTLFFAAIAFSRKEHSLQ